MRIVSYVSGMLFKIGLVQYNFHVGFTAANVAYVSALYDTAANAGADLVVFPEMTLTGYPPEDLVLSSRFQELSIEAVQELAALTAKGPAMLVGGLWREGESLYNAVFLLEGGRLAHKQYKHHLPNYGVFDEKRLFTPGPLPQPVEWRDMKLGLMICEDMWFPDITAHLASAGAEILICVNASPYETGKSALRQSIATARVRETGLPLVYLNLLGGQDELVFDGGSFVIAGNGELCTQLHAFMDDLAIVNFEKQNNAWKPAQGVIQPLHSELASMYNAMLIGLRDFVNKNGYSSGVILGMSGGIDSALSAAIAVDALGANRVRLVLMPSPVTSQESIRDATECAKRLGVRLDTIPIAPGIEAFGTMLSPFAGKHYDIAVANNHTRIRAGLLMALCAMENALLLTTGNKSEMATGYTSMYGDMCGHYSVLKDVYKTTVYRLARWRNEQGEVIPQYILTRAPTAETLPCKTDQDTLPPYDILDEILLRMVEQNLSIGEIVVQGYDRATVEKVSHFLFGSEYKRRQSAPGVRLSGMSFGRDRRYPLTSPWRADKMTLRD